MPVEGSLDQLRLVRSSIARLFHFNPSAMPETNTHHGIPHIYVCCLNHSTIRKRIRSRSVFRIPSTLSIHLILTLIHNAYCSRFPPQHPPRLHQPWHHGKNLHRGVADAGVETFKRYDTAIAARNTDSAVSWIITTCSREEGSSSTVSVIMRLFAHYGGAQLRRN